MANEEKAIGSRVENELAFEEVLSRVFPLPADAKQLQKIVDEHLNHQDKLYFQVTSPFVYMQLLSYAKMKDKPASEFHTSQRELLFMVPVECYERIEDEIHDDEDDGFPVYQFNGHSFRLSQSRKASVTPFIFVDNELSVVTGREEFGWSKGLMEIVQTDSGWVDTVQTKNLMVAIDVRGIRDSKVNRPRGIRLLEINRSPGFRLNLSGELLMKQIQDRLDELTLILDIQSSLASYFLDTWKGLLGLGLNKHPTRTSTSRVKHYLGSLVQDMRRYMGNTIGAKEFLDSGNPDNVAYFSIIRAKAKIVRIPEYGFLGSIEAILTTLSGGFSIKISALESHPVVERLGLKFSEIEKGVDGAPDQYVMAPVFPFWLKADVEYKGNTVIYESLYGDDVSGKINHEDRPEYMEEYNSVNWEQNS
ncbi:MAG: hypothetical protein JJ921_18690 [Pseudomonadales bacterium]|nr:hypothetical protein [Pseudomonadales bacterium]MBO7005410.1 hypothetical protein [Pseudomonadales bacterium]